MRKLDLFSLWTSIQTKSWGLAGLLCCNFMGAIHMAENFNSIFLELRHVTVLGSWTPEKERATQMIDLWALMGRVSLRAGGIRRIWTASMTKCFGVTG